MEKGKMVFLEPKVHNKIKHIATDKNSSIQKEVNDLLKKDLKIENGEENERENEKDIARRFKRAF